MSTDWNSFARTNAAERWKRQSAVMGRPATEAIVREAQIIPNLRVLDVACGTGEPAISIATAMNGTGKVIATDISPIPLEVARQRASQRNLTNIEFQQADAHELLFADESFDRVTSRLGIMFFTEAQKAFAEIYRVLARGGQFSFLAWGPYEQPYFQTTAGTILRVLPNAEVPRAAKNMFRFADLDFLREQLRSAGFTTVDVRHETVPWTWNGPAEEVWEYFKELTIPFKALIDAVPEERRVEIDSEVVKAMKAYEHFVCAGNVNIEFTATFVLGTAFK